MLVFLLWRAKGPSAPEPRQVADRFAARFAPLFATPPTLSRRSSGGAELATLELPIDGWRSPLEQEDARRWVQCIDPPVNARAALARIGAKSDDSNRLLVLAERLESDPRAVLRELAPPASLLWEDRGAGALFLQGDGLGHAQLFEYEDAEIWAATNRVMALPALGIGLEPLAAEWATRFTLGWFPDTTTGFRGVRTLAPGTRLRISAEGIERRVEDVLREWVHPPAMTREESLELGAASLVEMIDEASAQWENPSVGLSGGWDSRTIVSILRHRREEVRLRVRGLPHRIDVIVANELARIAGLKIRTKTDGGMPPESAEEVRRCLANALLWQGGAMHLKKHATFQARGPFERGGVNVMGSHAGIGKADFAVKIAAHALDPSRHEAALLDHLTRELPPCLRAEHREPVFESIRASIRTADRYSLDGLQRLHFFFLHEYTRRWAAGAINASLDFVVTPFLNPDFIRACYAFPPEEIPTKPFHRHVTARFAPDWAAVPYESQVTKEDLESGRFGPVRMSKSKRTFAENRERWGKGGGHRVFHNRFFWKDVGKPLIREARYATGSFCHEIFDQARIRELYKESPDAIAAAHLLPELL